MKSTHYLFTFLLIATSFSYAKQPVDHQISKVSNKEKNSEKIESAEQLIEYLQSTDISTEEQLEAIEYHNEAVIKNYEKQKTKKFFSDTGLFFSVLGETAYKISSNDPIIEKLSSNHELTEDNYEFIRNAFAASFLHHRSKRQIEL